MATKDEVEAVADWLERETWLWFAWFLTELPADELNSVSQENVARAQAYYQAVDLLRQFAPLLT